MLKKTKETKAELTPAIWEVSREGHNWVNALERYRAVISVVCWIKYQSNVTQRKYNPTHFPNHPSVITFNDKKQ